MNKKEEKDNFNIIGYFIDDTPEYKDWLMGTRLYVVINELHDFNGGDLTCYQPIGQHGGMCSEFLNDDNIREITKEEYIELSAGIYTPSEYLK